MKLLLETTSPFEEIANSEKADLVGCHLLSVENHLYNHYRVLSPLASELLEQINLIGAIDFSGSAVGADAWMPVVVRLRELAISLIDEGDRALAYKIASLADSLKT